MHYLEKKKSSSNFLEELGGQKLCRLAELSRKCGVPNAALSEQCVRSS